ncbi:transposase family protein [Dickeya poaceiphila]|uniref:Transposase family protein n=1 Tax=Dickeya poaceiphila TaxID=568768 RepID=A0A5B8HIY0_9GAMM|nr:transposase family protein [Dickeya poaceiphila]
MGVTELRGEDVVAVMERLKQLHKRVPGRLQTDNGSEFISRSWIHGPMKTR